MGAKIVEKYNTNWTQLYKQNMTKFYNFSELKSF